jgi:hypothetical protein
VCTLNPTVIVPSKNGDQLRIYARSVEIVSKLIMVQIASLTGFEFTVALFTGSLFSVEFSENLACSPALSDLTAHTLKCTHACTVDPLKSTLLNATRKHAGKGNTVRQTGEKYPLPYVRGRTLHAVSFKINIQFNMWDRSYT